MKKFYCNYVPCDGETKRPFGAWKKYQSEPYRRLFKNNERRGIICGKISDGLEVLDFDNHNGKGALIDPFIDALNALTEDAGSIIERLAVESTPSGGYHLYYRCKTPGKNQVLAKDESGGATIETRGEGGFIVCAPSPGYCLDRDYRTHETADLITDEERALLFKAAASLNRFNKGAKKGTRAPETRSLATLPAGEDKDSPSEILRTDKGRDLLKQELERAGYYWRYVNASGDLGGGDYYAHRSANDDKEKLVLSSTDNFLHLFAASQYGGLERATSSDLSPLDALSLLWGLSVSETSSRVRSLFPATAPPSSLYPPALSLAPADSSEEEDEEDEDEDSGALDLTFNAERRALFPPYIVDAVKDFSTRTIYPQRMLYAVNLFSLAGLLLDKKIRLYDEETGETAEPRSTLPVFNVSGTGSGKDGVRTSVNRLFREAMSERFRKRPRVYRETKQKSGDVEKLPYSEPKTLIENITSKSAIFKALSVATTVDRLQRIEEDKKRIGTQDPVCYGSPYILLSIDEASDVIGAGGTTGDKVKGEAFGVVKTLTSGSDGRITLDDGLTLGDTLQKTGLDSETYSPSVSVVMFTTPNVAKNLKSADFEGGFVNRFLFALGEDREAVKRGRTLRHSPAVVSYNDKVFFEGLAVSDPINVTLSAKDRGYYFDRQESICKKTLSPIAYNSAIRLEGHFGAVVSLSAILRAYYNEKTKTPGRDETEPIIIKRIDVDFAFMLLSFCRDCVSQLTADTINDNASGKEQNEQQLEDALIIFLKSRPKGVRLESIVQAGKYWQRFRVYGKSRTAFRLFVKERIDAGLFFLDESGKIHYTAK